MSSLDNQVIFPAGHTNSSPVSVRQPSRSSNEENRNNDETMGNQVPDFPLSNIDHSSVFPGIYNVSNTTKISGALQKKLSQLTTNTTVTNSSTHPLSSTLSNVSLSLKSRKRLNSEGLTRNSGDSEMTDASYMVVQNKASGTPPTKKRLVDPNASTTNSGSTLHSAMASPTSTSNSEGMPRISTPSNTSHIASMPFSDDLQQLPLPSPSASPIQSGQLHEIEEGDNEDQECDEIEDDIARTISNSLMKHPLKSHDLMRVLNDLVLRLPPGSDESNMLLWNLLQRTDRSTLSSLSDTIKRSLRKDIITLLPSEITMKIFGYVDYVSLLKSSEVCKNWLNILTQSYDFWKDLLFKDGFISTQEEFNAEYEWIKSLKPEKNSSQITKAMYRRRLTISRRWKDLNFTPRRITLPDGANVITCLQFDGDKIVAGSDDHRITIYDTLTGATRSVLSGHNGGVWAMKYTGNTLASGSTDRSVRIWNIKQGKCTHIFRGHTSTVRCLEILEPRQIGVDDEGKPVMFPTQTLLVTGSRDSTLYVWKLPMTGEDDELPEEPIELEENSNKYLVRILRGHTASVRAVSGYANTLVSISYDTNVRVWDLRTGECKWLLSGHTDRIYSCVLDTKRNRCISGSVDNTVRIWDLNTGETMAVLEGHQMLVGLITLSDNALVSAAADSTVRIWDPQTGDSRHVLRGHTRAITCVQHDDNLIISGSNGMLKMWDTKTGKFIRDLLDDVDGDVWQAKFDYRRCVAAVQKNDRTFIEILDFEVPGTSPLNDYDEDQSMDEFN
ncbi:hypothetical protein CANARDRAFT_28425 [[Candida] arabinofermentans NRRL YB-2248]|uniref:F-box domain-containing protein n=1 Tax=[Candida] arabinofermentans NRRL YB-2248 TaxID=983967 RepID=A0A1E4T030_9ASCO|nr:hypothetical protein CANARDRAFT_28425 [[Candida] arabinofermentans NRRL YB-2248]